TEPEERKPNQTKKMDLLKSLFSRKKPEEAPQERESNRSTRVGGRSTMQGKPPVGVKVLRIMYTTDEEVRDALVEFGVFIIFLILTSLVTLSVRHSYMFYFNDTMGKLFTKREMVIVPSVTVSFEKLITVSDWWDYLYYNFFITLHGDMQKIGDTPSTGTGSQKPPPGSPLDPDEENVNPPDRPPDGPEDGEDGDEEDGRRRSNRKQRHKRKRKRKRSTSKHHKGPRLDMSLTDKPHLEGRIFLHENLLLGPPRIRQIRVAKDSCFVNDAFIRYFNTCYAAYSPGKEEIKDEHGGAPYRTMSQLDATPLWTTLHFYRSGGYTIDMSYDKVTNLNMVKQLRKDQWLDRGSRLCLIEFNLYNENTDILQSTKLIAEIPATGGVIPQAQLQTVKLFSFITDHSLSMTVVYIFFYIMVVYYNINEINEMRKSGVKNYFKVMLNVLDSIILLASFCYLALLYNIWHAFKVRSLIARTKLHENYQSLDSLCFWNTIYVDMMAILAFLVWIKIFKFISFNKTLVQFTTTLKRCSKDLAGFSVMFGIVFLAYAQLGLLLFGTKHPDFRNFITSILTMIRMILGDFQYNLIEQANRVLGPIYFITYILLVFFILLNMFLAIIMETYNSVKSEITQGRSQLGTYVYKKLSNLFYIIMHCGRKRQPSDTKQKVRADNQEFADDPSAGRYEKQGHMQKNMTPLDLNNRVSLLEEVLEQLVTNMDSILHRVEKELKKHKE
ncbi:hypothetical protein KR222_005913, partial [Zaprionus bogoriensis]